MGPVHERAAGARQAVHGRAVNAGHARSVGRVVHAAGIPYTPVPFEKCVHDRTPTAADLPACEQVGDTQRRQDPLQQLGGQVRSYVDGSQVKRTRRRVKRTWRKDGGAASNRHWRDGRCSRCELWSKQDSHTYDFLLQQVIRRPRTVLGVFVQNGGHLWVNVDPDAMLKTQTSTEESEPRVVAVVGDDVEVQSKSLERVGRRAPAHLIAARLSKNGAARSCFLVQGPRAGAVHLHVVADLEAPRQRLHVSHAKQMVGARAGRSRHHVPHLACWGRGVELVRVVVPHEHAEALRHDAAVAVGPRTPGFGGSASRLALRLSDTAKAVAAGKSGNQNASQALWVDSRYLDGGRPFPAPQQYKPVPLSPSALKNATSAQAASSAAIAAANPDPNGLFVILTAADPKAALAARRTAREPHLLTAGPDAEATRSSTPASVDTTAPNARLVSGSFGTAPVPVPRQTQRPAVGGLGGEAVASSPLEGYEAGEALLTTGSTLYVTSTSTTDSFLDAGEAAEAGKVPEVWEWSGFPGEAAPESSAEGAERRRLRLRRRLLRDAAGE